MSECLKDPPIEWLNAVGRSFYKERDCPTQEYALDEARWLWSKPRFAKMEGDEAYEINFRERQKAKYAMRAHPLKTPAILWVEAYQEEWELLCAGECDFEGPCEESYDLWHKHQDSDPTIVATQRFMEVCTPEQREEYRQMTEKEPWIDLTKQLSDSQLEFFLHG